MAEASHFDEHNYYDNSGKSPEDHHRSESSPPKDDKLGYTTIFLLVVNRTIGSGIFVTPTFVLKGTGSVGASLCLWLAGGIIGLCGVLVWLEIGLSIPLFRIPGEEKKISVPRSGGEKNYLEFFFKNPKFLTTCMYGIMFIVLGNLSGNALAFATFATNAAGHSNPSRGIVDGIAIGALTVAILLHVCSRRGGIHMNNAFGVVKILFLIAIVVLGFVSAGGHRMGGQAPSLNNFNHAFSGYRHDVPSYFDSFIFVVYTFSGFEQPFYVLSECKAPRKRFPRATLAAMGLTAVLFMLVNVAYFCVVPKDVVLSSANGEYISTLFFQYLFGLDNEAAVRAMSAMIAVSIFGNILVMTFTASRVKQEIAKEGVLPLSLTIATSLRTPWAILKTYWKQSRARRDVQLGTPRTNDEEEYIPERTPMAALALHWLSSVILIAATAAMKPRTAYQVLVSLYSYAIVVLVGCFVAGGLLLTKFKSQWKDQCNFKPIFHWVWATTYFTISAIVLVGAFVKPTDDSPYSSRNTGYAWYVVPTIGLTAPLWGFVWWIGLHGVMRVRGKLVVIRTPLVVQDDDCDGQWIQKAEVIDHDWRAVWRHPPLSRREEEDIAMDESRSGSADFP